MSISTPAVSSASSIAFLIDSTAASTLMTTPRRMPFESARPMPMMSSPPSSVISPTIAVIFDVPTSSPTRYRSFRATGSPFARCACRRDGRLYRSSPTARAARTRDRRTAGPRSRCPARARAASARAPGTTAAARRTCPRRGAAAPDRPASSTTASCASVTSICEIALRRSRGARQRLDDPRRELGARLVDRRACPVLGAPHQAVDDRQVELARTAARTRR